MDTLLLSRKAGLCRPVHAQIELTYRCNLQCVHCYCKGSEKNGELGLPEWKEILTKLHRSGVLYLEITGGEPLLRDDFTEIYDLARSKGFLITLFTNGSLLTDRLIRHLAEKPPHSIEITLNGITKDTYESITGVEGSFEKVMDAIHKVSCKRLPLVLKSNGLRQNKGEIVAIKKFTEELLGKKRFKFDSFVTPRLDGERTPCDHRLSAREIAGIEGLDAEMSAQREEEFGAWKDIIKYPARKYHCNAHLTHLYITPYGRLRFCHLTDKYSGDLRRSSVSGIMNGAIAHIRREKYRAGSECISCDAREFCHHCPPRAFLETGDEDAAVPYFCELARAKKAQKGRFDVSQRV